MLKTHDASYLKNQMKQAENMEMALSAWLKGYWVNNVVRPPEKRS